MSQQLDLYRHSPAAMARANRLAAETERRNPYYAPDQAEARARYYEGEAERLEKPHTPSTLAHARVYGATDEI